MTAFERCMHYIFFLVGTLMAAIHPFGYEFFKSGDFIRGSFYCLLTIGCAVVWIAPLLMKQARLSQKSMKAVTIGVSAFMIYNFIQTEFLHWLPSAWH